MNTEILVMLYEQLLLVEGLLLGVVLGVLLWRHKYLLNRRLEAGHERGLDAPPAPAAHALDGPASAPRLYRVH